MSTNDTFLCMANGASGIKIKPGTPIYEKFRKALTFVALTLAKMIVKDGEGATKFIEIHITGAKTPAQAKDAAFGIANSNLVKCAIYGENPNIGRVASACGASNSQIKQDRLDIYFNEKRTVKNGTVCNTGGLKNIFKKTDIRIRCELNSGKASHRVFASDLSKQYLIRNRFFQKVKFM